MLESRIFLEWLGQEEWNHGLYFDTIRLTLILRSDSFKCCF